MKGDNYKLKREYFAQLIISEVEEFTPLREKKVLDVGGARGEFCRTLSEERGCEAVNLEPDPYRYGPYESGFLWDKTVKGYADNMDFNDDEFDVVTCWGTFEHIPSDRQQKSLDEIYRVTKKGGLCYISIEPWYCLFAGHGLKPFHYFPFKMAKFLAEKTYGKKIDAGSWAEKGLFPVTFGKMSRMIDSSGFKVVGTRSTHFRMHILTRVPFIREISVPVTFILTKSL